MMRSPHLSVAAALAASFMLSAAAAGAEALMPQQCRVPHDLIEDGPLLTALAQRIRDKQPIVIVVIGGASTAGNAAGGGDAAYPHRLEEALRLRHPGLSVTVANKGVARQTTEDMVGRFAADVFPLNPNLVIWETGTVDAARAIEIEQFTSALEAGIAALQQHHLEAMLIDMQYNPGTASVINFEPYLDALHRAADLEDVYLFRRYDIMKYWSEAGVFDFVDVPQNERGKLAGEVYQCLGDNLAEAIDFATR